MIKIEDPLKLIGTRVPVGQTSPIPGRTDQVRNNAGGYVFAVDKWTQLHRFLILGTQGGTYYVTEPKLTKENADVVFACLDEDGERALELIVDISVSGRAPKVQPAIFALAAAAGHSDETTRRRALELMPKVCRIGTHLFLFLGYVEQFRGWGRGLRTAVADWYLEKTPQQVAYQTTKYAQRGGWSHRDALRLAKPRPPRYSDMDAVLARAVGKLPPPQPDGIGPGLQYVGATEAIGEVTDVSDAIDLIAEHNLPWETVPSALLRDPKIWEALVPRMGLTVLIRNLGRLTDIGYIKPFSAGSKAVVERLTQGDDLVKSRVHPLAILTAEAVYRRGAGIKGSLTWTPDPAILDALDAAFYASFGNVEPSGKRTLVGLDVSGSMSYGAIAGSPLTPREASTALALLWMNTEPQVVTMAFSDTFMHLPFQKGMPLGTATEMTRRLPFQQTDCSLPMLFALQHQIDIDHFVVITDNETYAGRIHPTQALAEYRRHRVADAKLSVIGMVSNGFTIADPKDPGMMDVVGFDTAVPDLLATFARGF